MKLLFRMRQQEDMVSVCPLKHKALVIFDVCKVHKLNAVIYLYVGIFLAANCTYKFQPIDQETKDFQRQFDNSF